MQPRRQLYAARISRNISRREAAKALNITESYYGMIENGARQPALDLAQRIAQYFDSSIDELFYQAA